MQIANTINGDGEVRVIELGGGGRKGRFGPFKYSGKTEFGRKRNCQYRRWRINRRIATASPLPLDVFSARIGRV